MLMGIQEQVMHLGFESIVEGGRHREKRFQVSLLTSTIPDGMLA